MSEENTGAEGQAAGEGEGSAGEGSGEGEGEGSTVLTGGEGEGQAAGEGEGAGDGDAAGEGEGEGEGEGAGEVPETYEFPMPEGYELDQAMADKATPLFKELGLNQDQANKITELAVAMRTNDAEAANTAFNEQLESWDKELREDPDFGGDNYEENAGATFEWVKAMAPKEITEDVLNVFESTGIGNHPAMVKLFFHLSQQFPVGEDQPGGGGPGGEKKPLENRMYPNEKKVA